MVAGAAIAMACSGPRTGAPAAPRGQWEHLVGWYHLGDGGEALLTWGADTDLRLVRPSAPYLSEPFRSRSDGTFAWQRSGSGEAETRAVRFTATASGGVAGFTWVDPDGDSGLVSRRETQPYALRELEYRSREVPLSGTLLVPRAEGPVPAAVMIHGSGDSDRDNLWYLAIADHLARHGVAVLLPDKRGCGRSGGDWRTAGMEDLAADALAGVEAVGHHPGIAPAAIGLLGCSQGGSIAPLAASGTPGLSFVVGLSGGVASFNEILLHESRQTLRQEGLPGALADALAPLAAALAKRRRPIWWRKNGEFTPLPHWRRLELPTLVVYGAEDERDNVPVAASVARLQEARLPDLTVVVYPDSGHGLFEPGTRTLRRDFLGLLTSWILEKASAS